MDYPEDHPLTIATTQVELPDDAFIRHLPIGLNESERFRLDAVVGCADMIADAYRELSASAAEALPHIAVDKFDHGKLPTVRLLRCAWSIVDNLHSTTALLNSLGLETIAFAEFKQLKETIYFLRNRMDHPVATLPNVAKSKSAAKGLFGCLSFIAVRPQTNIENPEYAFVSCNMEPIRPGTEIARGRTWNNIAEPLGNFALHAADKILDIDLSIRLLGRLMTELNENIEDHIKKDVRRLAAENGVPESNLLASYGSGFASVMFMRRPTQEELQQILDQE